MGREKTRKRHEQTMIHERKKERERLWALLGKKQEEAKNKISRFF
jgi:hypothetical protein